MTIAAACAELAQLWPGLPAALTKDTTGVKGTQVTAGAVVNAEVLHAMIVLRAEIPAAVVTACGVVGEPWQPRTVPVCLTAIPRLAGRMHDLRLAAECADLEDAVRYWLRLTKRALGLVDQPWDLPSWVRCPDHDIPSVKLLHVGAERAITRDGDALRTERVRDGYLLCPHCGAKWPLRGYESHLERLVSALRPAAREAS